MAKFTTILTVLYFLYYSVNIVYDLFIKKDHKPTNDDTSEEFLVQEVTPEQQEVKTIGIDDVETLSNPTPNEYITEETDEQETPDLDELHKKFEQEQEIDSFESDSKGTIEKKEKESKKQAEKNRMYEFRKQNKEHFKQMMRMAETNVHVTDNIDGQKVYHSTMQF